MGWGQAWIEVHGRAYSRTAHRPACALPSKRAVVETHGQRENERRDTIMCYGGKRFHCKIDATNERG